MGSTITRRGLITALAAGLACRRSPSPRTEPNALWLGGDLHLGEGALALEGLDAWLAGAAGIVNLEGPVAATAPAGALRLHNAPAMLSSLKRAGIRVAGIANNHDRDCGSPEATVAALEAAGIAPAGAPAGAARLGGAATADEARAVVVTAHDLTRGVPADLAADLAAAAKGAWLVATFHVTGPPSLVPRPELRRAVDVALAAGARVVASHGTHAVGPVERRGEAIIAWGLGNLAFACDCTDERDGAIVRVELHEGRANAVVVPVEAGLRGAPVRPARDPDLMLDLFAAIGSSPLARRAGSASF